MSKRPDTFLGSKDLAVVLDHIGPLSCLDIGARGGVTSDIEPLGDAASVYGFEPDADECERLNDGPASTDHPYASLEFLPFALGPRRERRTLNIMQHEGASSLLEPDPSFKERFKTRSAYFDVKRKVAVDTVPLDDVIDERGLDNPVYMKIDVEGFELEILKGAEKLLGSSLLAIRSEIVFTSPRIAQPDFGEIAAYLKPFEMMPMGFLYLVDWRSQSSKKHPRKAKGPIPYSRGQTIHGDVVFLRDPMTLTGKNEADIRQQLTLAFMALLYDYVDVAHDIFVRPAVRDYLQNIIDNDGLRALGTASKFLARRHDRRSFKSWRQNLVKRLTSEIKSTFAA